MLHAVLTIRRSSIAEIRAHEHGLCEMNVRETHGRSAAIDWAFDALGWSEVIHSIGIDNRASQRVAEKLGSAIQRRIDNEAPFEGCVVDVWGQRREHWLARKPLS